jgi:phosphorylated CTD-interacting factor 1
MRDRRASTAARRDASSREPFMTTREPPPTTTRATTTTTTRETPSPRATTRTTTTKTPRRRWTAGPLHALTKAKATTRDDDAGRRATTTTTTTRAMGQSYDFAVEHDAAVVRVDAACARATARSARAAAHCEARRAEAMKRVREAFRAACERRGGLEAPPQLALERWRFATKLAEEARGRTAAAAGKGKTKRRRRGACGVVGENTDAMFPNVAHDGATKGTMANDLMRAGVSEAIAIEIEASVCAASAKEVVALEAMKQKLVDGGAHGLAKLAATKLTIHKHSRDLTLGDDYLVKLTHEAYGKLRALYEKHSRAGGDDDGDDDVHDRMFALLLRYKTIHGHGFQAACSHDVFRVLHDDLKVTMECFASPMNAYFARFCSAFGDVDAPFGSIGSFAAFQPSRGSYEVNPPFVREVLDEAALWCEALLERAEKSQNALTFVFIMPGWKETGAFDALTNSAFLRANVLIAAVDHGYCDGASHQRRDPYRASPYDTCVFVLQSSKAARDVGVKDTFATSVRVAMARAVPTLAQLKRQKRA